MTGADWASVRATFKEAAQWFVRTAKDADGHWDEPALGEWSVRDLVGHTSRALLTVETYLDQPATAVEVDSAADYFARASVVDPAAVAQRGRDAGAALGDEPTAAVAAVAARVLARVEAADPGRLVQTAAGGMRLVDYLPTRTFELTVHTCDLASALGRTVDVPDNAALVSVTLIGELAVRHGKAAALLLSATGRGSLPSGFSVL